MRKSLLIALLAAALLATPAAFSTRSDAANPLRQDAPAAGNRPAALPNYDIRLAYRDEFDDAELNTDAGRQRARAARTPRCVRAPRPSKTSAPAWARSAGGTSAPRSTRRGP